MSLEFTLEVAASSGNRQNVRSGKEVKEGFLLNRIDMVGDGFAVDKGVQLAVLIDTD